MIIHPKQYLSQSEGKCAEMKLADWDILCREEKAELEEAQRVIQNVLTQVLAGGISLDDQVLLGGENWMKLGNDLIHTPHFL
jgi:tryptophanyl-tRNA synthetase